MLAQDNSQKSPTEHIVNVSNAGASKHSTNTGSWFARLELGFSIQDDKSNKTRLTHRKHQGPLRVQRPFYPEQGDSAHVCHVLILHPPAGIAGGDSLQIDVRLESSAHALLTNPGATKWYGANNEASQYCAFEVGANAILEWLPQETIVFNEAQAKNTTDVFLDAKASLLMWEITVFGRQSFDEVFISGNWQNTCRIYRKDKLLVHDLLNIQGGGRWFTSPLGMHGNHVMGCFWATKADRSKTELTEDIDALRKLVNDQELDVHITMVESIIIMRFLGAQATTCMHQFSALRALLRKRWFGFAEHYPRIWKT